MTAAVQALIVRHGLVQHPEGGWYRETHRSDVVLAAGALPAGYASARRAVTSILFLLPAGERSARHRVRSEELWLHQAGDALRLDVASPDGERRETILLGPDEGMLLQYAVPPGWWQAAEPVAGGHGYALVGCVVAPGFDFTDFAIEE